MTAVESTDPTFRLRVDTQNKAPVGTFLSSSDVLILAGCLIILFTVRVLGIVVIPFTDTTEARYAEIARKMVETNDWITPQFLYGVPFWGKPPLHTWLSAGGMKIFGINEFGGRIFIFLIALLTLWLVFYWVKRNAGGNAALVSMTVLGSSALFFGSSAFVSTDMPMVFGTSLSMIGFWNALTHNQNKKLWGYLFFIGISISLLSKGPVGAVLTGIPIFLWLLIGNRWSLLKSLPIITGSILCALTTAPWYLAAEYKTPGFLEYFLIGEHFERFLVPGWEGDLYGTSHKQPKGMIWAYWLLTFMPWTISCIASIPYTRKIIQNIRADVTGFRSYLLLWAISPMIFFSFAGNILPAYVLPGFAAAAILLVIIWQDIHSNGLTNKQRYQFIFASFVAPALIIAISFFSVFNSDAIRLKSQKHIISQIKNLNPDAEFSYWGKRSYSGEFYTNGAAKTILKIDEAKKLLKDDAPTYLIVRQKEADAIPRLIKLGFINQKDHGRYIVLTDKPIGEDGS